jgi:hypothetical protein
MMITRLLLRYELCIIMILLLLKFRKVATAIATTTATTTTLTTSAATMSDRSIEKMQSKSIDKPDWLLWMDRHTSHTNDFTCDHHTMISAWCDHTMITGLQCGIHHEYNEYGCICDSQHPSLCPTECLNDSDLIQKTHHTIRCYHIPIDPTPNYEVLHHHKNHGQQPEHEHEQEDEDKQKAQSSIHENEEEDTLMTLTTAKSTTSNTDQSGGCENNLLISSWCDNTINPHLTCYMDVMNDQYGCHCSGKMSYCPMECIHHHENSGDESLSSIMKMMKEPIERTNHHIMCSHIPIDQPNYILK